MFAVEVYAAVRQFVFNQGKSRREAARVFGLSRETVAKMCRFSLTLGYTRTKPVEKSTIGPLVPEGGRDVEAEVEGRGAISESKEEVGHADMPVGGREGSPHSPASTKVGIVELLDRQHEKTRCLVD